MNIELLFMNNISQAFAIFPAKKSKNGGVWISCNALANMANSY